jgi:hypothetical protein
MQISSKFFNTKCICEALVLRCTCVPDKMGVNKKVVNKNSIAIINNGMGRVLRSGAQPPNGHQNRNNGA